MLERIRKERNARLAAEAASDFGNPRSERDASRDKRDDDDQHDHSAHEYSRWDMHADSVSPAR